VHPGFHGLRVRAGPDWVAGVVWRSGGRRRAVAYAAVLLILLAVASRVVAKTSHAGWPQIDGMLLMNKDDSSRPLDARPGRDPFGGQDPSYSCDTVHEDSTCVGQPPKCVFHHRCQATVVVPDRPRHNELLGGHGDDAIHAGPWGDVIWGDFKASGQPETQVDRLWGGDGRDFIYASHGRNVISAGGGPDVVKAHFGRGSVDCGDGRDVLYISRRAQRRYRIAGCETVSHRTLGY